MISVGVMQVPVHQIVDVIAVGDRLVSASGAVLVAIVVRAARVIGRAVRGVGAADRQLVLVDVVRVRMVQVPIVQVVGMTVVADRHVATAFAMRVRVPVVSIAGHE